MTNDHDCCACVERLRRQNKESSDEWTRRTADLQSRYDGLVHLMEEAVRLNRNRISATNTVIDGLSRYGQAALAAALQEADEMVHEVRAAREEAARWRRKAEYAESTIDTMRRAAEREKERATRQADAPRSVLRKRGRHEHEHRG